METWMDFSHRCNRPHLRHTSRSCGKACARPDARTVEGSSYAYCTISTQYRCTTASPLYRTLGNCWRMYPGWSRVLRCSLLALLAVSRNQQWMTQRPRTCRTYVVPHCQHAAPSRQVADCFNQSHRGNNGLFHQHHHYRPPPTPRHPHHLHHLHHHHRRQRHFPRRPRPRLQHLLSSL
jgi:hypothetical protein